MQTLNLNLARKWRPKTFDTIVGQDIPIKMLKNGLYLNKFFPVYLFAGQRGCGKTSSARVFAAALNCHRLEDFQNDPQKQSLPCMTCDSCISMSKSDHPDFIEIDAASHTGVDNVRQIIESSSYMPLTGRKKIYLIDEAHMLSKAAFNAFLKILEEPPASVTFILATTEIPKIPTTVLSRCFQLIFNPIQASTLKTHLQKICSNENVVIEDGALDLLIEETEGSARDAINLLERVRFSNESITEQSVLRVLGKISTQELLYLFEVLLAQEPLKLLNHLQDIKFQERNPQFLWDMIIGLCRALVWTKYGAKKQPENFIKNTSEIKILSEQCSINRINAIFQLLWNQEELFLKTSKKHIFLEMVLLQICQQVDVTDLNNLMRSLSNNSGNVESPHQAPANQELKSILKKTKPVTINHSTQLEKGSSRTTIEASPSSQATCPPTSDPWKQLLKELSPLADPLLNSILGQATFVGKQEDTKRISIKLATINSFFTDKIEDSKKLWQPLLKKYFDGYQDFELTKQINQTSPLLPINGQKSTDLDPKHVPSPSLEGQKAVSTEHQLKKSTKPIGSGFESNSYLIISSPDKWPMSSLLLRHFPGKIRKIGPSVSSNNLLSESEETSA